MATAGMLLVLALKKIEVKLIGLAVLIVTVVPLLFPLSFYSRITEIIKAKNVEVEIPDKYFAKVISYRHLLSGDYYREGNPLLGNGPATFSSRSSVIRMPMERQSTPPFYIPEYKSDLYIQYGEVLKYPRHYHGGNFTSFHTTFISIGAELGLLGLLSFLGLFIPVLFSQHKQLGDFPFGFLVTAYFLIHCLHLNYFEYPTIAFCFIIFGFSGIQDPKEGLSNQQIE